jgi:hypothetical protein
VNLAQYDEISFLSGQTFFADSNGDYQGTHFGQFEVLNILFNLAISP